MTYDNIRLYLQQDGELIPASEAEVLVPEKNGLYSIVIDKPDSLPPPFSEYVSRGGHNVIYIGKAFPANLTTRLVKNDLRHKGNATFFRSLGAVLGYFPPQGSLVGKENSRNYRFRDPEKQQIVDWINEHLGVRCKELEPEEIALEQALIEDLRPVFNIVWNPDVLQELKALRAKCRLIALTENR